MTRSSHHRGRRCTAVPVPPHVSDRVVPEDIVLALFTGIDWTKLSAKLSHGSGWGCWPRMWKVAEVGECRRAQPRDCARLAGLIATDRASHEAKLYPLVNRRPLTVAVSGANCQDSMLVGPILKFTPGP